MKSATIAQLTDAERLLYVSEELCRCEANAARALLEFHGLPATPIDVHRLVFGRHLFMNLRLREFV